MTTAIELESIEIAKPYLRDRIWRIDNLYHVKDKFGITVPFVRNESQVRFWEAMWYLNLILKDRQRGFSTLIAIFFLDYCMFNAGTSAGIIDITIDDAAQKLAKCHLAYDKLHPFVKAMYPLTKQNTYSMEFENGSSIRVGTSHRGGTLQLLHISELGKIAARFPDRAREIRTGALNTIAPGNIIMIESTAEGNAGYFYELCMEAIRMRDAKEKLTLLDWKFHFFPWFEGNENEMDPDSVWIIPELAKYFRELEEKTGVKLNDRKKAWYVKKESQQQDDMKREYPGTPEEAFEAAVEGAYLSKIITKLNRKGMITTFPIEPGFALQTGWDYGLNDLMTIWVHQRVEFDERLVWYMEGDDDDVLYYWSELERIFEDAVWGYHFLPHDFGSRRGGTAEDSASEPRTLEDILKAAGMRNTKLIPRIDDKRAAINEVKIWLKKPLIHKINCSKGLKCLNNFRREWDEINGCWKNRPRHDWAMHGYDGLETLVRGLNAYGAKAVERRVVKKARKATDWRVA